MSYWTDFDYICKKESISGLFMRRRTAAATQRSAKFLYALFDKITSEYHVCSTTLIFKVQHNYVDDVKLYMA